MKFNLYFIHFITTATLCNESFIPDDSNLYFIWHVINKNIKKKCIQRHQTDVA